MTTRVTIAALFTIIINGLIFAVAAAAMLSSTTDAGGIAAYLLPATLAMSLFVSPLIGWVVAPTLNKNL